MVDVVVVAGYRSGRVTSIRVLRARNLNIVKEKRRYREVAALNPPRSCINLLHLHHCGAGSASIRIIMIGMKMSDIARDIVASYSSD